MRIPSILAVDTIPRSRISDAPTSIGSPTAINVDGDSNSNLKLPSGTCTNSKVPSLLSIVEMRSKGPELEQHNAMRSDAGGFPVATSRIVPETFVPLFLVRDRRT